MEMRSYILIMNYSCVITLNEWGAMKNNRCLRNTDAPTLGHTLKGAQAFIMGRIHGNEIDLLNIKWICVIYGYCLICINLSSMKCLKLKGFGIRGCTNDKSSTSHLWQKHVFYDISVIILFNFCRDNKRKLQINESPRGITLSKIARSYLEHNLINIFLLHICIPYFISVCAISAKEN